MTPVLLAFCVLEFFQRAIPNDYSYKKEYLEKNAEDIEVLILGNSHYYRGIIAEDIDLKCFNAAYISQSADLDFLIFNTYKDRFANLKYIVFGTSYSTLFSSLATSKERWRLKNYNLYYDFNITQNPKNYSELLSNSFEINKKRFSRYYFKNKNPLTTSILGSGTVNGSGDIEKTGPITALRDTKKDLYQYKNYLDEYNYIIKYCAENNITVIFLTAPAYKSYTNNLSTVQLSLMNRLLDSISNSNKNVYWMNFLKDSSFDANDFYDGDHLKLHGAKKITDILKNKLDSL